MPNTFNTVMDQVMNDDLKSRFEAFNRKQSELRSEFESLRQEAINECRLLIETFGLSAAELKLEANRPARVTKRSAGKPKYQNPAGDETWTGMGVQPKWFKQAIAAGISREDMLIS